MTDIADKASEHESQWLARSLAAQQAKAMQGHRPDDASEGERLCIDCGEVIPAKRIKANPCALRCIDCQSIKELKEQRGD
ncbi:TraR/DksA C4-type zinc finger protein [Motilimonas cestriensis]|uniref:TraR/DksA C4-type zinc finger protein n=1 Tax=Motilimonas cestriensis TaxID=2742685 RepID=A0ABS8W621_9GAMM|nr:TraR/DksA C4-type zinc finger protein [Motilimonas cestriensis]MCE2594421.1 TraR/DksA C4-type zinc finger protein [Motilimonas cestriensis]